MKTVERRGGERNAEEAEETADARRNPMQMQRNSCPVGCRRLVLQKMTETDAAEDVQLMKIGEWEEKKVQVAKQEAESRRRMPVRKPRSRGQSYR